MLDVFRHQRGKVYPSWTDNPRLVLARRLRDMPINAPPVLAEGFAIYHVSDRHYKVLRSGSEVFYTYRAGNQGGSGPNLTAANIQHVLDFIFHEETSPMALPPLSDKAIDCLIAIHKAGSIKPGKLDYHGSIINRLQERQLIKSDSGRLALTLAGEAIVRETLEARQQPAENGRRPRKVRHLVESKAPEPEDAPAPPTAVTPYEPPPPALTSALVALGVEPAIIARLQISIFDARDPGDEEV